MKACRRNRQAASKAAGPACSTDWERCSAGDAPGMDLPGPLHRAGRSPALTCAGALFETPAHSFHSRYGWLGLGGFCLRLCQETRNAPATAAVTTSAIPSPIHAKGVTVLLTGT